MRLFPHRNPRAAARRSRPRPWLAVLVGATLVATMLAWSPPATPPAAADAPPSEYSLGCEGGVCTVRSSTATLYAEGDVTYEFIAPSGQVANWERWYGVRELFYFRFVVVDGSLGIQEVDWGTISFSRVGTEICTTTCTFTIRVTRTDHCRDDFDLSRFVYPERADRYDMRLEYFGNNPGANPPLPHPLVVSAPLSGAGVGECPVTGTPADPESFGFQSQIGLIQVNEEADPGRFTFFVDPDAVCDHLGLAQESDPDPSNPGSGECDAVLDTEVDMRWSVNDDHPTGLSTTQLFTVPGAYPVVFEADHVDPVTGQYSYVRDEGTLDVAPPAIRVDLQVDTERHGRAALDEEFDVTVTVRTTKGAGDLSEVTFDPAGLLDVDLGLFEILSAPELPETPLTLPPSAEVLEASWRLKVIGDGQAVLRAALTGTDAAGDPAAGGDLVELRVGSPLHVDIRLDPDRVPPSAREGDDPPPVEVDVTITVENRTDRPLVEVNLRGFGISRREPGDPVRAEIVTDPGPAPAGETWIHEPPDAVSGLALPSIPPDGAIVLRATYSVDDDGEFDVTATVTAAAHHGGTLTGADRERLRIGIAGLAVQMEVVGGLDSGEPDGTDLVVVEITVENGTGGPLEDVAWHSETVLYELVDIPAELRASLTLVGEPDPPLPSTLADEEVFETRVVAEVTGNGFAVLAAWVTAVREAGDQVSAAAGVELGVEPRGASDEELDLLVHLLLEQLVAESAARTRALGGHSTSPAARNGQESCGPPPSGAHATARDLGSKTLPGSAAYAHLDEPARIQLAFLHAQASGFAKGVAFAAEPFGVAASFYADLYWAQLTDDVTTRDRMIGELVSTVGDAGRSGADVGSAILGDVADVYDLDAQSEGRRAELAETVARTEQNVKDMLDGFYETACRVATEKLRSIDQAASPEEAAAIAGDVFGQALGLVFFELLFETTGVGPATLAINRVSNLAEDAVPSGSILGPPGDKVPTRGPDVPSDAEIAQLSEAGRKYALQRREEMLAELRAQIPADDLISIERLVEVGGLPLDDALAAQAIARELTEKYRALGYDVEILFELRTLNPHSLKFWDMPGGATAKNELMKAKNASSIDSILGVHDDALGQLAVFPPRNLDDVKAAIRDYPPPLQKEILLRHETQTKYWEQFQDFRAWEAAGRRADDVDALGSFAQILAKSTGDSPHVEKIPVPGRVLDPDDPSSYRLATAHTSFEELVDGTVLIRDRANGNRPIVSDADWHATINGVGGQPLPAGIRGKIELEAQHELARRTKTFGGHGMSVNGSDFEAVANTFRLEFLYEQLPAEVAAKLKAIRGDSIDLAKVVTGQKVVKISPSGFFEGYGSLPGAGWASVGRSKAPYRKPGPPS